MLPLADVITLESSPFLSQIFGWGSFNQRRRSVPDLKGETFNETRSEVL